MCSRLKLTALNGYSEVALELFILLRKGQQKRILAIIRDFPVLLLEKGRKSRSHQQGFFSEFKVLKWTVYCQTFCSSSQQSLYLSIKTW